MNIYVTYADFDILCLAIMSLIMFMTMRKAGKLVYQKLYSVMIALSMGIALSDMLYNWAMAGTLPRSITLMYIANALFFLFSIMLSFVWLCYSREITDDRLYRNRKVNILMAIPAAVTIIILISSFWNGLIFYIDAEGYQRGPLNELNAVVDGFYFGAAIIWTVIPWIKERSAKTQANVKLVLSFSFFPIITILLQTTFVGIPAASVGDMLAMLWVYFSTIVNEHEKVQIERAVANSRTQLFASMSHEIRTPVNAVLGMNTMILRESDDPKIIGYARLVDNSGKMLLATINDILDFSKAESGKLALVEAEYNPKDMAKELYGMFSGTAEQKELVFTIEFDSDIPKTLYGDEVRIKQVIINLLSNAFKYTQKGGVRLSFKAKSKDNSNTLLGIAVSDTGKGIKKEDISKLFLPFQRLDETQNRKIEGTGLGMMIVKQLLDIMDSKLDVESTYGEGSVFAFDILQKITNPVSAGSFSENSEDADEFVKYSETLHTRNARILYIDDTIANLTVFKALLSSTGLKIDTATSGLKGLVYAKEYKYDIIFVDHLMPEMDGIETLKLLRSDKNYVEADTPVIILTANAFGGSREYFIESGFTDFLSKPIIPAKLQETLLTYLPKECIIGEGEKDALNAGNKRSEDNSSESMKAAESNTTKADDGTCPEAADMKGENGTDCSTDDIFISELKKIEEIDLAKGLELSTNASVLKAVVEAYYSSARELRNNIEAEWKSGDIKDYTIHVHSLKSSSKMIGATKLGEFAERLEKAGHENRTDLIDESTEQLLKDFETLYLKLEPIVTNNGMVNGPQIDETELHRIFNVIATAAEDFDFDTIEENLKKLEKYSIPGEYRHKYENLCKRATEYDCEGIIRLLGGDE